MDGYIAHQNTRLSWCELSFATTFMESDGQDRVLCRANRSFF